MTKIFNKIPILRTLVNLRVRQIDIVDSVEHCEQIAVKFEKLVVLIITFSNNIFNSKYMFLDRPLTCLLLD